VVSTVPAEVALSRLAPEERQWVGELQDRLRSLFGSRLRDMRLFGSKARGDFHDESGIDILVLIDACDSSTAMAITDIADAISPWLSPVIQSFDGYHAPASRASGFYEELRRESIRL